MKFRFKIQQYQTDAVDSVVRVFGGQPYLSGVTYVRDLGKREPKPATSPKEEQLSMLPCSLRNLRTILATKTIRFV